MMANTSLENTTIDEGEVEKTKEKKVVRKEGLTKNVNEESKKQKKATPIVPVYRSSRKRKPVKQFTYEEKKPVTIEVKEGRGVRIHDIPEVAENIRKTKTKDLDLLKAIFRVMFTKFPPKTREMKQLILDFNGLPYDEDDDKAREIVIQKISKWNMFFLKDAMDLLMVDRSKKSFEGTNEKRDKDGLTRHFVKWLECPSIPIKGSSSNPAPTKKRKVSELEGNDDETEDEKTRESEEEAPFLAQKEIEDDDGTKSKRESKSPMKESSEGIEITEETIKEAIEEIMESADDRMDMTIKDMVKLLEEKFDTDIASHLPIIRQIFKEIASSQQ